MEKEAAWNLRAGGISDGREREESAQGETLPLWWPCEGEVWQCWGHSGVQHFISYKSGKKAWQFRKTHEALETLDYNTFYTRQC